jgi:hypothetical protein
MRTAGLHPLRNDEHIVRVYTGAQSHIDTRGKVREKPIRPREPNAKGQLLCLSFGDIIDTKTTFMREKELQGEAATPTFANHTVSAQACHRSNVSRQKKLSKSSYPQNVSKMCSLLKNDQSTLVLKLRRSTFFCPNSQRKVFTISSAFQKIYCSLECQRSDWPSHRLMCSMSCSRSLLAFNKSWFFRKN